MRLGFYYHVPFGRGAAGAIQVPGYLGRFLDSLAAHCDQLLCFAHSAGISEQVYMDYTLRSQNVEWIDIGRHASVPYRTLHAHSFTAPLRRRHSELDALLLRGPSPLLPAMANAIDDLPLALLLVGDYRSGVDDSRQPRWRKEAIRAWVYWNYRQQLSVAKRSLTFVNSRKLFEQLQSQVPNLVETRTTTLYEEDFFEREDTCQQNPIRLLYTGRMDRAKGLFEIVGAIDLLVRQGYDVIWDLVGWPAQNDNIIDELLYDAQKRRISDRVIYHGFKAVGSELFEYYRRADIYVTASQSSEGFPRTIWEAMAHSVPVVATKVGSIPYYLVDRQDAVIVNESSDQALSDGIATLIETPRLRREIIKSARDLARKNTLEHNAPIFLSAIEAYVQSKMSNART